MTLSERLNPLSLGWAWDQRSVRLLDHEMEKSLDQLLDRLSDRDWDQRSDLW